MTDFEREQLKRNIRDSLDAKIAESAARPPMKRPPRYDEVFVEGTEWLDALARVGAPR